MKIIWLVAGVVCFAALFWKGTVQAGDSLIGTWRLVGASSSTDKGDVTKEAYGPNPTGILTFTADGRMMAIIAMGGRKPLSVPDRVSAPAEERADAFSTFIAYAGRYSFDGNKEIVHIDVSSLQNWVGTDQVRFVSLRGDRVTLSTPPMPRGGVMQTFKLVWERLK
ncbi:MAG: lipocalin-like domain-containing protein [Candidatus Sulfotelmatobacter sp.]